MGFYWRIWSMVKMIGAVFALGFAAGVLAVSQQQAPDPGVAPSDSVVWQVTGADQSTVESK